MLSNILRLARFCSSTPPPPPSIPQQKPAIFSSSFRAEHHEHIYEPIFDLMAKSYRKMFLERGVIDFRKVVVPAKRMRDINDHLVGLKKKNEVAAVILGREEFGDVDVIFDHFQISAVKKRISGNVAPIHVRLPDHEGTEIRCTLRDFIYHPTSKWPWKVYLQRYVVGRPNLLYMPIRIEDNFKNPWISSGLNIQVAVHGVWVYCYNNVYPTEFKVDIRNIEKERPFKLGDLQNSFPQGIVLHERYKRTIHQNIIYLMEDEESVIYAQFQQIQKQMLDRLNNINQIQEGQDKPKQEEVQMQSEQKLGTLHSKEEIQAEQPLFGEFKYGTSRYKPGEKPAPKKRREKSFKKRILKASQELKEEMAEIFDPTAKQKKDGDSKK